MESSRTSTLLLLAWKFACNICFREKLLAYIIITQHMCSTSFASIRLHELLLKQSCSVFCFCWQFSAAVLCLLRLSSYIYVRHVNCTERTASRFIFVDVTGNASWLYCSVSIFPLCFILFYGVKKFRWHFSVKLRGVKSSYFPLEIFFIYLKHRWGKRWWSCYKNS